MHNAPNFVYSQTARVKVCDGPQDKLQHQQ